MRDRKDTTSRKGTRDAAEKLPEPHDPISGSEDFHPAGTTRGALAGGAMGAALGAGAGGPVGAMVGGALGAVAGGLTGKQVAEHLDRPTEVSYWSTALPDADYYDPELEFERDYLPAFRLGWEARSRWAQQPFDQIRRELEARWPQVKERSRLHWATAERAVHDAWQHLGQTLEAPRESAPASPAEGR